MKKCVYNQKFRSEVLKSAKSAYKKIFEKHKYENIPMYRNRSQLEEAKSLKKCSAQNWWQQTKSKKSHTAILFVPPHPQGGLAKALRKRESELNSTSKMSIRIIEQGGTKIKSILTKSDPFPTVECDVRDCPYCQPTPLIEVEEGQNCRAHNIGYSISCKLCPMKYEGESHRKISVRSAEHVRDLRGEAKNSPLYKHIINHHPTGGCSFKIKVTGKFKDALTRQADEGARIKNLAQLCMNSKAEFNAPPIKRIRVDDAYKFNSSQINKIKKTFPIDSGTSQFLV